MRVAAVLALVLAFAPAAFAATGVREAVAVEPAASWAAGKPVKVLCVPGTDGGETVPGSDTITLDTITCPALRARLSGKPVAPGVLADSLRILAHEAKHAAGLVDEADTDCAALKALPGMASRFFGFRTWRARHDLMALAWESHRGLPDEYQGPC